MTTTTSNVRELSSSLQRFSWPDYLVFLVMLVICSVIGIYFGFVEKKGTRKNDRRVDDSGSEALDYLVGGRKMQVFPVAMSLIASFVSGISLLGTSTEIYVYGTQYSFVLISIAIAGIIAWFFFLPVYQGLKLTSAYEYFEMRFDRRIRLFGSVLFAVSTIIWLPIVIFVPALAFNQVTGINIHIISPIVCIVCIFYTCVGGLKAVVWTDVIQTVIMFGAIFLVIIKGTMDLGGLNVVLQRNFDSGRIEAPELTLDPTVRYSALSIFVGGVLYYTEGIAGNQVMVQRFLAVPTLSAARNTLLIFIIGVTFLLMCCMYNGLLIYATYYDCDPISTKLAKAKDQLVPLLVMDILGIYPGLPGLFVAGVFSAALSSLSTGLNSLAAVVLEDFYKPYARQPLTEKQTAVLMRAVVVVCGVICVGLVFVIERLGMVLHLSMALNGITVGASFGIFLIGLCLPWINGKSTLTGGITALGVMSWVCIKAQIALVSGEIKYQPKPVSVEGCTYSFDNSTTSTQNNTYSESMEFHGKSIHHMSFLWYTLVGGFITIAVAILASFVFGFQDPRDLDSGVIAPFIQKFIKPREYLSVQPDIKERKSVIHAYETETTLISSN